MYVVLITVHGELKFHCPQTMYLLTSYYLSNHVDDTSKTTLVGSFDGRGRTQNTWALYVAFQKYYIPVE